MQTGAVRSDELSAGAKRPVRADPAPDHEPLLVAGKHGQSRVIVFTGTNTGRGPTRNDGLWEVQRLAGAPRRYHPPVRRLAPSLASPIIVILTLLRG